MKGPGTNEEQIKRLMDKLSTSQVEEAEALVESHCNQSGVVKLALKMMAVKQAHEKLQKNMVKMIDKLPEEKAAAVREMFAEVR